MTKPQAIDFQIVHPVMHNTRSNAQARRVTVDRWRLCVLISETLCAGRDWWSLAQSIVGASTGKRWVDCIQLREKSLSDRELLERAQQLVALCRAHDVSFIMNDRPDIAALAGADGVHLGQDDLPCAQVRQWLGDDFIIGVSTSCLDHAKQALDDGADYCGVGPMFPTTTKHKETIVGLDYLRQYLAWEKLPHLAIGGITAENVVLLRQAGARGIAASGAICSATDPPQAANQLMAALTDKRSQRAATVRERGS